MTRFTIPTGPRATFTIPAQPAHAVDQPVERIGFSIDETAESLGISVPVVRSLIKSGSIRSIRIGRRVIVSAQSLREFVDGKNESPEGSETAV
jgi:excisionase family DNA binding protein